MEGVFAGVVVVEDDVDDVALLEDEGVGVRAVDVRVVRCFASCEGRVEGRDFWGDVAYVVEEGVVGAVAEVVHDDCEGDDGRGGGEEGFVVSWYEGEVVEGVEFIDERWRWEVGGVVVV